MSNRDARPVQVVTDSTSDIPKDVAASLGIEVVPLTVRFGDETFRDGIDLSSAQFLERLKQSAELPKTSQPAMPEFESVFAKAIEDGQDVVCLTISSRLSGTFNSARLAAESLPPDRIEVVDSLTTTMHLGWAAIAAGRAAQAGKPLAEVVSASRDTLARSDLYALLETLDYVYKGGRIGKASALIGSVLAIKPILTLRDGEVVPLERIRTWKKAVSRLVEFGHSHGPLEALAVIHVGNPGDAQQVVERCADLVPADQVIVTEAGPVLATYAGPGALGLIPLAQSR
jgi:DegV family protein with EDD domain